MQGGAAPGADTAILLTNLGSPDSTRVGDVRRYLNEFLMDERVIDLPWWKRLLLVRGIITPFRAPKSARAYRSIWTAKGSPLIETTRQLRELVEEATGLPVYISMRYGRPRPGEVLDRIARDLPGLKRLVMLPLYPHYAMSSYETAVVHVLDNYRAGSYGFKMEVVPPFFDDPDYLHALAETVRPYLNRDYDLLLFSYHGVPERHIVKTDPTGGHCLCSSDCCEQSSPAHEKCYRHQVFETTRKLTALLSIPREKWSLSFQSRLGRDPWLQPYTAAELAALPGKGVKKLLVVCPAFVSDCLETLEEIEVEGKEIFMEAGGSEFQMIPCLNLHPAWVYAIGRLIRHAEQASL